MLKLLRRKGDDEYEEEIIEEELEEEFNENSDEEEEKKAEREDEDTPLEKIMERLNDIENRLPRMDVSINGLKREIDDLKSQLKNMEDSLKDVMVLYEVVSSQINPFLSSGGVIDVGVLKKRLELLEKDVKIIFGIDLDRIIDEVIYGGDGNE